MDKKTVYIPVKDMFSIGIGPSSSHTIGPMIAANLFREEAIKFLTKEGVNSKEKTPYKINIKLYGSLGATGIGHGTLTSIVAGLQGYDHETMETVDFRELNDKLNSHKDKKNQTVFYDIPVGINSFELLPEIVDPYHPNAMVFELLNELNNVPNNALLVKKYYSVGGGFIEKAEEVLYNQNTNVKDELKKAPTLNENKALIAEAKRLVFTNTLEMLKICSREKLKIYELAQKIEINLLKQKNEKNPQEVLDKKIVQIWQAMEDSILRGLGETGELPGGLGVFRRAKGIFEKAHKAKGNNDIAYLIAFGMAVSEQNSTFGRVVTAPTLGSSGVMPSVLYFYLNYCLTKDNHNKTAREFVPKKNEWTLKSENFNIVKKFILTANVIGSIIKTNGSISGAESGCQGEVGSACSMAAAGLSELFGGNNQQIENAAEVALEHLLGLTCDPVAGLVQIPCIERNGFGANNAFSSAKFSLLGTGSHVVSLDTAIKTMLETGKDIPEKYRETSRGGLAINFRACR